MNMGGKSVFLLIMFIISFHFIQTRNEENTMTNLFWVSGNFVLCKLGKRFGSLLIIFVTFSIYLSAYFNAPHHLSTVI